MMKTQAIATVSLLLLASAAQAAVPAAPAKVRQERLSPEQVRITWEDRSSNETGFEVLRRPIDSATWETRGTVGAGVTSFVENLPRTVFVVYTVVAFNGDGDSAQANQCYANLHRLMTPTKFAADPVGITSVQLSWQDNSSGEKGFEVQRGEPGKGYRTIARLPEGAESFLDAEASRFTSYLYRVRALGNAAVCQPDSRFSEILPVTTGGAATTIHVDRLGMGTGRVRSEPAGIDCGPRTSQCDALFPIGVYVTLTAEPNATSRFVEWQGIARCDATTGPCTFYNWKDRSVGALFRIQR